jgi:hypothetical protein
MISIMALVAMAGVASAADGDDDTLLNFGYDEVNHIFIVDVSGTDEPYDCSLEDGILTLTYGEAVDLSVPVDTLEDNDGTFEFDFRPAEEVGEEFEPATEPALYEGSEGPCGLTGTVFDGVVNHGAFVSAFNAYLASLDLQGRGCVVRIIAQSSLGQGDQQITGDEVDPEFAVGDTGTIEFTAISANCEHGRPDFGDDHPGQGGGNPNPDAQHGRPEHAGSNGTGNGR